MTTQTIVNNVTTSDAAWANDVDTAAYCVLTSVAGTNTVTATGPANYTYAATKPPVWFIPAVTNTGATTINITPSGGAALGAKNIFLNGAALTGGELVAGKFTGIVYDGTQFNVVSVVTSGRVTQRASVYQYTAWDPTDVAATYSDAPATAAATDPAVNYITVANSSGTTTWTCVTPGVYRFTITGQNEVAAAMTFFTLRVTIGGTATFYLGLPLLLHMMYFNENSGFQLSDSRSFTVVMTAGQTVTILPAIAVTSGGVTTNFTQQCTVSAEYVGT
jgi:hypothetical protein